MNCNVNVHVDVEKKIEWKGGHAAETFQNT